MPQLPERPDLDQLRRRARELHRAAAGGDARSLRRLQAVSARVTLSAAQLAIAREHGFPGWPKLKAEVERRRSAASPAEPALLTAEAGQLIDAQYAGRSQLRPILDKVLRVLPLLGPVTVQARKTFVSLVSPRRTFAVVQATTKTRVDLGLRLDGIGQEAACRRRRTSAPRPCVSGSPGPVRLTTRCWAGCGAPTSRTPRRRHRAGARRRGQDLSRGR